MTKLLLISGSLRAGSSNTAALRTVQDLVPAGVSTDLYAELAALPHFNPDDDQEGQPLQPAVADLRARIGAADAVLFSTPEYAGGLPGSFKNLLDWTVGGSELYGRPVAWLNVAGVAAPTGAADAHDSLRKVLGYAGATLLEAACVRLPLPRQAVGADGLIDDPELRERLRAGVEALLRALEP